MGKTDNWKSLFSEKSNEELFDIYCGQPKHYPKEYRYYAGRLLEGRDFQFDMISSYKETWAQEKLQQKTHLFSTIISNFVTFVGNSTQEIREKKTVIELSH